jgi:4-alpha-glucanotransferase
LVSATTHDLPTIAGFWRGADIEARRAANMIDGDSSRQQWESRVQDKQKLLDALFAAALLPEHYSRDGNHYQELTPELQAAVIGYLAQTPSELFAINQEDLTGEPNQQNLPGTTWQYPNWGRKMRFTVEELGTRDDAQAAAAMVRRWVERTGRLP